MTRSGAALGALLLAIVMAPGPAVAQDQPEGLPWIPPEYLEDERRLDDDELTFCLNADSALVDFDRAVAEAIAELLLLEARFHMLESPLVPYLYDFRLPFNETQLFIGVTNNCDALMGYRLTPNTIPQWLTVSRPYFESKMIFASADERYTSLDAVPDGTQIGVRIGGTGHRELRDYLAALPETARPSHVPYPTNELLIERLADGTVPVIFVWELAPYFASDGDPAALGIKATFDAPFPVQPLLFGIAMPERDTFTRGLVDEAIAELEATGVIEALAGELIPGAPGKAPE